MNRLEIRNLVRKRLGETTSAFWSDAELNKWINDGCKDVAFRVKCIKDNTTITPTSENSEYILSSVLPGVISITEVYFLDENDKWTKLMPTSRVELDSMYQGWLSADSSTAPTHYWWDREDDIFYIYPSITEAEADSIRVFYTKTHSDIGSDESSPTIPEALHLAIVDFTVAMGFDTRGWMEKANDAWNRYTVRLNDYITERKREPEDREIIMRSR